MRDAIFAFLLWGGWAAYSNYTYGLETAAGIGLSQGIASLCTTLVLAFLIAQLFQFFTLPFAKRWLPTMLTVGLSASLLYTLHSLLATPNLLQTILPPIVVAMFYCLHLNRRHWHEFLSRRVVNE